MWRICIPSKVLILDSLKAWLIWGMPSPTVFLSIQYYSLPSSWLPYDYKTTFIVYLFYWCMLYICSVSFLISPFNNLHSHMWTNIKKTHKNSLYIFRQQGNILHFSDMLHNLLLSTKWPLFYNFIFSVQIIFTFFIICMLNFKYQLGHLKVKDHSNIRLTIHTLKIFIM